METLAWYDMQRALRTENPRVSIAMRRSMLQLEEKARWLRPVGSSLPPAVTQPLKKKRTRPPAASPRTRTLPDILTEYRQALERLEVIEAELADWLSAPLETGEARPTTATPVETGTPIPDAQSDIVVEAAAPSD